MAAEREDFLTEDPEIPGQKFCLLSFLSPEKVLASKDIYFFERYLKNYELNTRITSIENYLVKTAGAINRKLDEEADKLYEKDLSGAAEICKASRIRIDGLIDEFQKFVSGNQKALSETKLKEDYDDFVFKNKAKLEDEFYAKNDFRTTVRGLKVRGVYSSQAEAVARSKKLQRLDTLHNIFVGEIGKWLPWDPAPHEVGEQEYAEEELNTLMKKYKENEEARENFEREKRSGATKKNTSLIIGKDTASAEEMAGPAPTAPAPAAATNYADMFNNGGPADLAIARKMGSTE